jgi:AcrR family transcriptional regulator
MPSVPSSRPARRSSVETKARIIEAAQIAFSTRGYAQSVLTEIAESADVTAPLIIRYFGSKEGLFEDAFSQSIDALPVFAADPADFGKVSIGMMTGGHEPTQRASGMIAHSIGDPRSREITMRLIRQRVLGPLTEAMGAPDGAVRAELMVMLGIGYTTMRMVLPVDNQEGAESQVLADWLINAVQSVVDWPVAPQPDETGSASRKRA